jgi:hypothetical protein
LERQSLHSALLGWQADCLAVFSAYVSQLALQTADGTAHSRGGMQQEKQLVVVLQAQYADGTGIRCQCCWLGVQKQLVAPETEAIHEEKQKGRAACLSGLWCG